MNYSLQLHFKKDSTRDRELQKMLTSPLFAQKASEKPNAMIMQERETCARNTQVACMVSLRSHSSEGQKVLVNHNAVFHLNRET